MIKFPNRKAKTENTKESKNIVLHAASKLYNNVTEVNSDGCNKVSAKKKEIDLVLIIQCLITVTIRQRIEDEHLKNITHQIQYAIKTLTFTNIPTLICFKTYLLIQNV